MYSDPQQTIEQLASLSKVYSFYSVITQFKRIPACWVVRSEINDIRLFSWCSVLYKQHCFW